MRKNNNRQLDHQKGFQPNGETKYCSQYKQPDVGEVNILFCQPGSSPCVLAGS